MIASYAAYQALVAAPFQRLINGHPQWGTVNLHLRSTWVLGNAPTGVTPTTAAVCTSLTVGAFNYETLTLQDASTARRVARAVASFAGSSAHLLVDRLSHQGGLSGTVTGVQTTNLPTAALTRYVSGVGVVALLEIYVAVGATATTIVVSYTNQAGVAGQLSPAFTFGGSTDQGITRAIIVPLASGDTGVRSVENVNILATTGTAGNFGVTLVKPLQSFISAVGAERQIEFDAVKNLGLCFPKLQTGACLQFLAHNGGNIGQGFEYVFSVIQE